MFKDEIANADGRALNYYLLMAQLQKGKIYYEWTRKGWGDMFDKYYPHEGWLPDSKLNCFIQEELKRCF